MYTKWEKNSKQEKNNSIDNERQPSKIQSILQRVTAMNGPRYGNSINKSASMLAVAFFVVFFFFYIVDLVAGIYLVDLLVFVYVQKSVVGVFVVATIAIPFLFCDIPAIRLYTKYTTYWSIVRFANGVFIVVHIHTAFLHCT